MGSSCHLPQVQWGFSCCSLLCSWPLPVAAALILICRRVEIWLFLLWWKGFHIIFPPPLWCNSMLQSPPIKGRKHFVLLSLSFILLRHVLYGWSISTTLLGRAYPTNSCNYTFCTSEFCKIIQLWNWMCCILSELCNSHLKCLISFSRLCQYCSVVLAIRPPSGRCNFQVNH